MSDTQMAENTPEAAKLAPKVDRKAVKFQVATLATPFDDVVKWDRDKQRVRFDPDPGVFMRLEQGQLNRLTRETQERYLVAEDENRLLTDPGEQEDESIMAQITANYTSGNADARLKVRHERPGYVYQWIRPDMVEDFQETRGYKTVVGGPERTLANAKGTGPHIISRNGSPELVLVMRDVKTDRVARQAKKRRNAQHRRDIDATYEARVRQAGVPLVNEGTQGDFAAISESDE